MNQIQVTASNEEINTGKKWFDGRDIFAASFQIGYFPISYDASFQHGLVIDKVINITASMLGIQGVCFPLPFASPTGQNVSIIADSNSVFVNVGDLDCSKYTGWICIEYVKP